MFTHLLTPGLGRGLGRWLAGGHAASCPGLTLSLVLVTRLTRGLGALAAHHGGTLGAAGLQHGLLGGESSLNRRKEGGRSQRSEGSVDRLAASGGSAGQPLQLKAITLPLIVANLWSRDC